MDTMDVVKAFELFLTYGKILLLAVGLLFLLSIVDSIFSKR